MLRIPLPEDDGFALTLPEDNQTPTGRQITDGGKQRVAPGYGPQKIKIPLPREEARGRGNSSFIIKKGRAFALPFFIHYQKQLGLTAKCQTCHAKCQERQSGRVRNGEDVRRLVSSQSSKFCIR